MMQTDVKAATVTGTGSVLGGPARVKGIYAVLGTGAGAIALTDGSGGSTLVSLATPASATQNPVYIPVPGEGVRFFTSIYAGTLTNVSSLTVFYG